MLTLVCFLKLRKKTNVRTFHGPAVPVVPTCAFQAQDKRSAGAALEEEGDALLRFMEPDAGASDSSQPRALGERCGDLRRVFLSPTFASAARQL